MCPPFPPPTACTSTSTPFSTRRTRCVCVCVHVCVCVCACVYECVCVEAAATGVRVCRLSPRRLCAACSLGPPRAETQPVRPPSVCAGARSRQARRTRTCSTLRCRRMSSGEQRDCLCVCVYACVCRHVSLFIRVFLISHVVVCSHTHAASHSPEWCRAALKHIKINGVRKYSPTFQVRQEGLE